MAVVEINGQKWEATAGEGPWVTRHRQEQAALHAQHLAWCRDPGALPSDLARVAEHLGRFKTVKENIRVAKALLNHPSLSLLLLEDPGIWTRVFEPAALYRCRRGKQRGQVLVLEGWLGRRPRVVALGPSCRAPKRGTADAKP